MPSGTKKYCQVCAQSGRQSRLKLYQINFNEAIQLCENKSCSFPLEASSQNPSIHQRDLSLVPPLKRKSSSTRSVKSAVSTPFGTPTVLSPVSFASSKVPKTPSCDSGLFINSILSDNLVNGTVTYAVDDKPQELDLEDLLNIGAFDEPVKENCAVNGFKEPLPLKAQNPPADFTTDLQAGCVDFSRKYAAKTPKRLLRNTFEDIFDIDENTNVFPFDSDLSNTVSVDNDLSFCQLTNGFSLEKDFHKFGKPLDNLASSNINHALCSQDSESALDEEVRSIFEYSPQLFEKNNLWSNCIKDKMMAPIKDEGAGENIEMDPVSQVNDQNEKDIQENSEAQAPSDDNLVAGPCQSSSGDGAQQGCDDLDQDGKQINQEASCQDAKESEVTCSTEPGGDDVPEDGVISLEQPPEEIMDYEANSDPLPLIDSEEHSANSTQGTEHVESVGASEGGVAEVPMQTIEQVDESGELSPAANEVQTEEVAEGVQVAQDSDDVVCSLADGIVETEQFAADVPIQARDQVEAVLSTEENIGMNSNAQETLENQFESVCSPEAASDAHAEQESVDEIGVTEEAVICPTEECGTEQPTDSDQVPVVQDSCDIEDLERPLVEPKEMVMSSNVSEEQDCDTSNQIGSHAPETVNMKSHENLVPHDASCQETIISAVNTANCLMETQVNNIQYDQQGKEIIKAEVKEENETIIEAEENERVTETHVDLETSEIATVEHPNFVNEEINQDVVTSQEVENHSATNFEHDVFDQQAVEDCTEATVTSQVEQDVCQEQIQPQLQSEAVGEQEAVPENQVFVTESGVNLENSYVDCTGQVVSDNSTVVNQDEVVLESDHTLVVPQSSSIASDQTTVETQSEEVLDSNQTHMVEQSSNIEACGETVHTETPSQVTEPIVSDASVGEVTPVNDIVRTAFLSTGESLDEEHQTEAEGVISGHTYIVDGMQTQLTTADQQAFVSHHQNIVYTTSESQIPGVSEAYQYATVNEMGQAVDAQPFQTIENVPIFEHEVSNITQTYSAVTLGEQTVPVDSVVDHVNMSIDQMEPQEVSQSSVVGMEVDHSQGVLMSIPEQAGELMQNQIYTVPMTTAELPVTQTIDYAGINQVVGQQTDYTSQDDQLPDLTPVEQSVTLTSPGGTTTTTQGIVLQPGQQLIDGVVYTTVPHSALSNMAVTSQNGVFTIASPTASSAVTSQDVAPVPQAPILIRGSSTSVQDQIATSQPGIESAASIPLTTTNSQALAMVKDPLGLSEEDQAKILAELENDTGPIPLLDKRCLNLFVQWQNRDAMCWLDVVMIVLCNSPTIQKLFTDEENTMALKDSVLSTLLKAYYQAQHLMQKLTAKVHSDYKENLAKNTAAAETNSGDSKPGDGNNESPSVSAAGEPIQNASNSNTSKVDPSKPKTTTVVNKISLKSMQDYFKAMDILDTMREKIWDVLQPRLQCERGKNDSPLFALPLLVREPAVLKEKFKIKFKYTFDCDQCAYHQEDDHSKLLPSFPEVPADFNMIQPSFIRNCFQCKASGKRMKMTFSSIPDMLLLHFKEGLPHSRLNELCFTFGGETYMVTAVIQYKNNPDHFVAWIRNGTGDQWMECDDLKSTLCQFVTQEPAIPPNQIHIIMWEKNVQPSAARDLEETSACNILQSCLRVLQPDVMPGTSVVLPGKEALAQGLKRKAELNQNTVKYILSQKQGGKTPGIITLPAGANAAGLQGMKIVSLPPASSASGLLANVAGLSSGSSTAQAVIQGNTTTSSYKPVILQSKNRPTILSSMVTSLTPQQSTPTSLAQATSMRVVKSGNKIVYMPAVSTVAGSQIVGGKMISEDSNPVKTISLKTQNIDGQKSLVQSTSTGPNLKYIELDRSQIADQSQVNTGGKSKTYVVGADGILQEVIKDLPPAPSPVKKNVINIQAAPGQAQPTVSGTGAPKIIVKKKNERGEIVQTILTDLDCKQNSELMKAIESLKNGDTATGGAVIQQLIKGKEKTFSQSVISPNPVTTYETRKVISIKPNTPLQQPGTKYVQLGENMIQLQSSAIPPRRGRGRGRALARGGRKKRPDFRPVPIVTSSQMHIDAASPGPSEPQCIVISPPGQTKQTSNQVVKVLTGSSKSGTPIILSQSSAQTLTSTDKGTMSLQSVVDPRSNPHTVTTPQGTKITTLLAGRLAQGSVLQKNVSLDTSTLPSADKASPVKYILPNSPGQPTSPTKTPGSNIIKIQKSTPMGVTSLIKSTPSSTLTSPTTVSVSSPTKGISTIKVMPSGHTVGSPLGQSPGHAPEISSPSMGSPQTDTIVHSDSEGSKSPSKSPKYSPVISVQGPNADTAMIAKAIQTLVDKGVPIQQIQNQAFLSKLISTIKASTKSVATPMAKSLIQQIPKSSSSSASQSTSDPSIVTVSGSAASQTVGPSPVSQSIASSDNSKVVIGTSGISPMKQVTSIVSMNQKTSVTEDVSSDNKTPNIIVKPGQSYLSAVKPYLKLGQSKEKPKEFDEYKLKSDILKDKLVTDGGFTSIDMMKTKEKDRVVSNSTSVVVPQPIVPPKPDNIVAIEEPIEELVLPEPKGPPTRTYIVSPSGQVKQQSNIVVLESPGKVKKANPLHVIADAAVSRLPVPESTESLPKIQAPGSGRGRGRGRPPKNIVTVPPTIEIDTVKESLETQSKPVQKRSFMDAFDTPEAENPSKERKIETIDLEKSDENSISTISTPENFVKPKGRTRKQPVIPTPDSEVDGITKPQSESPSITTKGRGRPRKQSVEIEEEVKTPKSRGRPSSISPSPKSVGRPRKSSVEKIPTPEPKPVSQKKTPGSAQTKVTTGTPEDVSVTPRGRGRPPKNIVSPAVVKTNTPKQTFPKEVKSETPKLKTEVPKEKTETPKETDISELFNSPEVKYVGKYKILPIERPNTRRRKPESPVTSAEPDETLTEENKTPSSGKRRGRPPKMPAKRPKTE